MQVILSYSLNFIFGLVDFVFLVELSEKVDDVVTTK